MNSKVCSLPNAVDYETVGPLNTYIQPPDCFLDLERCVLSRPDFKAPQCFAGSTAIDFFLLRGPIGLRLHVKGLRYRSLGTSAILRFANMLY